MKCRVISIMLLFVFFDTNLIESNQESLLNVYIVNGFISLDCEKAKIEDVIEKISKKMGITYKIYPDMRSRLVTTKFEKLTFVEAIKRIVGENYAIVYADDKLKTIKKLFVFSKGQEGNDKNELIERYYKNLFPYVELLKKVVDRNVMSEQPNAQFYEMIPHYDLDGKLVSYVFSYYIGPSNVPDKKALENGIMKSWEEKKVALKDIDSGYNERNSAKIIKASAQADKASSQMSMEDDFITYEIGASYEVPPVIAFWRGLPLDVSLYPRALDVVNERLKDKNPHFKSTFTTGLFTIVFSFEGIDRKIYYVEPDNWKIFTSFEQTLSDRDEKAEEKYADVEKKNRSKWAEFLDI